MLKGGYALGKTIKHVLIIRITDILQLPRVIDVGIDKVLQYAHQVNMYYPYKVNYFNKKSHTKVCFLI